MKAVEIKDITIRDGFWTKHTELVKRAILPYQWDAINDNIPGAEPSHCLKNFKIAAREAAGEFQGAVFQDTDVAKWLEAVAYTLAQDRDKELEKTADGVIDLIGRAQCQDGYINTYFTIKEPEKRWRNLTEGHELYTAGHLIEAAVAYYEATGKRRFLDIVSRFADLICRTFGPDEGQMHGYPGHQEIELALVKLYHRTKAERYLRTAKYFIDARGQGENYFLKEMDRPDFEHIFPEFSSYLPLYSQSHLPVREQKTAEGHAVRAAYMYCAMADLAYEYQDEELLEACRTLWKNMVDRRMFVTGSIGSSGLLERFTADYDLPNGSNYSETCASIGLALFGLRMAQITREAKYMDIVERALYNTVLAGIALDGKSFFYVNPLEVWPEVCLEKTSREHVKPVRQKWFGVACCPPNIARTLASLGQYIYAYEGNTLFVNLFISNKGRIPLKDGVAYVEMSTDFPKSNHIEFTVKGKIPELGIRIPWYARDYIIYKNNETVAYTVEKGYAVLPDGLNNDDISISFKADPVFIYANPNVREDIGKVCIMRGPMVYCLEEADNGSNLPSIFIDTGRGLKEVWEDALFGGVMTIEASGKRIKKNCFETDELYDCKRYSLEDTVIKAVPYAYWNNRNPGEMLVWIKEL